MNPLLAPIVLGVDPRIDDGVPGPGQVPELKDGDSPLFASQAAALHVFVASEGIVETGEHVPLPSQVFCPSHTVESAQGVPAGARTLVVPPLPLHV